VPAEQFIPGVAAPDIPGKSDLFFVFHNRDVLVQNGDGKPLFPARGAITSLIETLVSCVYIGALGDTHCYSGIAGDATPPNGCAYTDLRSAFIDGKAELRPALSTAALVRDWVINTKYCGRCGTQTTTHEHEWGSCCPSCGLTTYPRMSPAVIVAVLKDDKILLAHNRRFSTPVYSLIAGFVEAGESLEGAVHREVLEETGLEVKGVRYFSSQCWPFPDSLMVAYIAEYASGDIKVNEELADAQWFGRDSMPEVPVRGPISRSVIDWYLETGGVGALPQEKAR
jgi:NAD+ diphosphatase